MPNQKFDDRTEKNIATLLPEAQKQAREFMSRLAAAGIEAKIISGTRTYPEQDALYAQGRTTPGKIVTNARAGYSNHNFGVAWDIGIFSGSKYVEESPLYDKAGKIGRDLGLQWGGDWKNIVDKPHYECKTGKSLAELRQLKASGQPIPILPLALASASDQNSSEVKILLNGVAVTVPARLIDGSTWVAIRAFVTALGGNLDAAGGDPFAVTVSVDGVANQCSGQIIGGTGYVKFRDLNGFYKLSFTFDSGTQTLSITR